MENQAVNIIKTIISEKIGSNHRPLLVTELELRNRYKGQMKTMYTEINEALYQGLLMQSTTINYICWTTPDVIDSELINQKRLHNEQTAN